MKLLEKIFTMLYALIFISVIVLIGTMSINRMTEKQEAPIDYYFVCNFEKVVDAYYQITYSKNGETYYPGFATREQGYLYLEHLEDIGSLDWNGYERN